MARIDRAFLDTATFPLVTDVPVRFADTDLQWHVNNVAAAGILQEARVLFNRHVRLVEHLQKGERMMVAAISIEYAGEMLFPGTIEVGTGIRRIGRTSYTLAQVARQEGQPRLYAETTLVLADASGPIAVPAALRSVLERLSILGQD